jgi:hypothetical protein
MNIPGVRFEIPHTVDSPNEEMITVKDLVDFLNSVDQDLLICWAGEARNQKLILVAPVPSSGTLYMSEATHD